MQDILLTMFVEDSRMHRRTHEHASHSFMTYNTAGKN